VMGPISYTTAGFFEYLPSNRRLLLTLPVQETHSAAPFSQNMLGPRSQYGPLVSARQLLPSRWKRQGHVSFEIEVRLLKEPT